MFQGQFKQNTKNERSYKFNNFLFPGFFMCQPPLPNKIVPFKGNTIFHRLQVFLLPIHISEYLQQKFMIIKVQNT